jgi:PhzF family phenazine biosynthesis protein
MAQKNLRVFQVDAFTDRIFTGNPAVVVLDGEALTDAEMQLVAREIGTGDCAFLLRPDGSDHDLRARFFTPNREVPYVGHATIAAHVVRATATGEAPQKLRQRCGIGIVEVDVVKAAQRYSVTVRQPAAKAVRVLDVTELHSLLDALGVGSNDLDPRCPVEVYALRATRMLIGLRQSVSLTNMKPDFATLARLTPHLGADGYFVFTTAGEVRNCLTEARMFCPAIGIPEDAVSGNAHGMLGAYLVRHGILEKKDGRIAFCGAQGAALGRPGLVQVEIEATGREPHTVKITGTAVIVFSTTMTL